MEFRNKFGDDFIKKNINKLGRTFQNNGDELIVNIGLYENEIGSQKVDLSDSSRIDEFPTTIFSAKINLKTEEYEELSI